MLRRFIQGQHFEQRRFAPAILPDDADELTRIEVDLGIPEHRIAPLILLRQLGPLKNRLYVGAPGTAVEDHGHILRVWIAERWLTTG